MSVLVTSGELRNRIYDYCVESGPITLPFSRPCFGGLRYACMILSIEYTPLYLARTIVLLQPSDVERYHAVFYPNLQSCG
ncbi:hypothetical protein BU25DRAFT_167763 [Macroventuria anomochaeta]|uniref:Uncharacterized protein n=1 Tax=Macroventuria anomochaeta TaxID=301207 RepID=A0ACB6RPU3_9PLEO|nr:uncharacterized protein BU25DRAFT_167763 [Macroventuria anomochaeta]KAF2623838.1 hypothetical protein BU25DRAFT_167763 [Macroventuria anomochaeta]